MSGMSVQGRRTTHAACAHAKSQRWNHLKKAAAWALLEFLPGGEPGRGQGRHFVRRPLANMDASPSANWPTAVLIAATSNGTPAACGMATNRKLRIVGSV